jgi:hypothetical protein
MSFATLRAINWLLTSDSKQNTILKIIMILPSCLCCLLVALLSATKVSRSTYFVSAFAPAVSFVSATKSNNNKNRHWLTKSRLFKSSSSSTPSENDIASRLYDPKTKLCFDTYLHNYRRSIGDATFERYWKERAYEY